MAFTYMRSGFPFQRFAQTLLFVLREMSLADRALQTVTGRSDLVCEPTTAAGCLPGSSCHPGISRRHQRRVKGLLHSAQGWEVKHLPTLLPSHTESLLLVCLAPTSPQPGTVFTVLQKECKIPFGKNVASSGCSETGNKNACD